MRLRITIFFLIILVLINILCLGRYPAMGGDEVFYALTAYHFLNNGKFSCPYFFVQPGLSKVVYYPPIIILFIYIFYWLFGFGIWQTKIVSLVLGVGVSFLFFLWVKELTKDKRLAYFASVLFGSNILTFYTYQGTRPELPFIFFFLLILYLAYRENKRCFFGFWLAIGISTGLAVLSYYPFAAPVLFISFYLWILLIKRHDLSLNDKLKGSAGFILGASIIFFMFIIFILKEPRIFQAQVLALSFGYMNIKTIGVNILKEPVRYLDYSRIYFGYPDIFLGGLFIFIFPFMVKGNIYKKSIWVFSILWLSAFALFFSLKRPSYLIVLVPFVCAGLILIYQEIVNNLKGKSFFIFKLFIYAGVLLNMLRLGLIAFTAVYQWQARNYQTLTASLQYIIPKEAKVLGPQLVGYALIDKASQLSLYSQGGFLRLLKDEEEKYFSNFENLNTFTHIIIQEVYLPPKRFAVLRDYLKSHFVLLKNIRLPFRALPWAKVGPFDIDVYVRVKDK